VGSCPAQEGWGRWAGFANCLYGCGACSGWDQGQTITDSESETECVTAPLSIIVSI